MAKRQVKGGGRQLDQVNVEELRAALSQRVQLLDRLVEKRKQLLAQVGEIDLELMALTGVARRTRVAATTGKAPATKPGPKPGPKPGMGRSAPRGPRTGNTLGNKLVDAIKAAGGSLRVKDAVAAVKKAGYPSKSPHLRSMINQTLTADSRFRRVRRGLYKLA